MRENLQTPIPAEYKDTIKVHSVFPTIQGEGPFCGERALFIRLYGCNLRCPGCDTEYTEQLLEVYPEWFVKTAEQFKWSPGDLIVITGGEPLRQNIAPAIEKLLKAGYRVQIETNGILCPDGLAELIYRSKKDGRDALQIVCSPKTTKIHPYISENAAAFKYVVRAGEIDPDDGLPTRALMHKASPRVARPRPGSLVYVQPMDEDEPVANALHLDAAIRSTMKYGYRLQIQVHKIINME